MSDTEVILHRELEMDAMDLEGFIQEVFQDQSLTVVYIKDQDGRILEHARLVKTKLTDGSEVFDIVLSEN